MCPDTGYSKYMYLGQLFEGAQAVQCFQKGIELMVAEKQAKEAQEVRQGLYTRYLYRLSIDLMFD